MCSAGAEMRSGVGYAGGAFLGVHLEGQPRSAADGALLFLLHGSGRCAERIVQSKGKSGLYERMERMQLHMNDHTVLILPSMQEIISQFDPGCFDRMMDVLTEVRDNGGRIFFLGVGGSAANASHAVNDFRKIAGIESYAPTDNVSELTARTNDEGWPTIFVEWLRVSRLRPEDLIFVLSVGGGSLEKNISPNLVTALRLAREIGTPIIGIVGKDGGFTAKVAA